MTHSPTTRRPPAGPRPPRSPARRRPRSAAHRLAAALRAGGRRDRATLSALELDWPGSWALLERVAAALASARDGAGRTDLQRGVTQGLAAYRTARLRGDRDAARLAAFVRALEAGLARPGLVANLLTGAQRAALAVAADA